MSHIFWNIFGLFMFGREVESVYGPKEFLRVYLVAATVGGILFAVRNMAMVDPAAWAGVRVVGASGAMTAVIILFCLHFPKRTVLLMFIIPVPAWVLGVIIVAGDLFGLSRSSEPIAFDVHLAGAGFALAYYALGWNLSRWTSFVPDMSQSRKWFKSKPKLKIHEPTSDPYRMLDAESRRASGKGQTRRGRQFVRHRTSPARGLQPTHATKAQLRPVLTPPSDQHFTAPALDQVAVVKIDFGLREPLR